MKILIFGDSIAYGAWDSEGGWVSRLRKFVDHKILSSQDNEYVHHIYNLGISGDTSTGVVKRFNAEMQARLLKDKDCAVVFTIGTNDSQFFFASQANKTSEQQFTANLSLLISEAKQYTDKIIFIGLPPVDDAKVNPVSWSPEKAFINEQVKKFDTLIQETCRDHQIPFIDVHAALSVGEFAGLLEDGVHPNSQGHALLFETIRDVLVEAEWI